jgi:hypothetical protein
VRITCVLGQVLHKLQKYEVHLKHKDQIAIFYKYACNHYEASIVEKAVFNLPCMHLLYQSVQQEIDINFFQLYHTFSSSENTGIKLSIARSLHEAFKLVSNEDDTTLIRQVFINFILDADRNIMLAINQNLPTFIFKYCNDHVMKNFKGRTVYICDESEKSESS